MRKKIFLFIAMANLFLVGAVLGQVSQEMAARMGQVQKMDGGVGSSRIDSTIENKNDITTKGGDADASAGLIFVFDPQTNTYYRIPKNNMPPVNAIPAPTVWPAPERYFLWNGLTKEQLFAFRRTWTIKEVDTALKSIPHKGIIEFLLDGVIGGLFGNGPEQGKGFKWQECIFDQELRPAGEIFAIEVKVADIDDVNDIVDDVNETHYKKVGFSGVTAESNLMQPQAVMCSLRRLFPYDIDPSKYLFF